MQVKKPKYPAAIKLIHRISREAMSNVLRYLDSLSAGRWEVGVVGQSKDGDYFTVLYYPTNRPGRWEVVFGMDGCCWSD